MQLATAKQAALLANLLGQIAIDFLQQLIYLLIRQMVLAPAFSDSIFCSCSAPKLPDELVSTADEVYIRFHGLTQWYRHDYTVEELAEWVRRIEATGCKRVWAYFNNDRDANAINNARELARQLQTIRIGGRTA